MNGMPAAIKYIDSIVLGSRKIKVPISFAKTTSTIAKAELIKKAHHVEILRIAVGELCFFIAEFSATILETEKVIPDVANVATIM